jgi:hypothetical protein
MSKGKKLTPQELRKKMESDKSLRKRIFSELCRHVERGYSLDCFRSLSDQSIRTYLKLYPEEFNEEVLAESMRKGKETWEDIGYDQATGKCLGNSRSWFLNMVNRYSWRDKIEIEAEHKGTLQVQVVNYASKKASQDSEDNDVA